MREGTSNKMLLTTDEAAHLLGLTAGRLAMWRQRGFGPPYLKIDGWAVRYSRTDLEKYRRTRLQAVKPESHTVSR
jgi:helix-turn-helix protein